VQHPAYRGERGPLKNQCNNAVLRKATRHLGQLFDDVIEPSGLRAAQHGILNHVRMLEGPTMKALAKALVMDLSALGHTLKPLTRDGYVVLVPDEEDRRAKRVFLTTRGEAKLDETKKLWRVAQSRVETVLGARTAAQLRDLLAVVASDAFGDAFRAAKPLP
jgi:DNA-binding MarR family transcriptional regulator